MIWKPQGFQFPLIQGSVMLHKIHLRLFAEMPMSFFKNITLLSLQITGLKLTTRQFKLKCLLGDLIPNSVCRDLSEHF